MNDQQPHTSLPEKDYLTILDIITRFYKCNTRDDLKQCFRTLLFPLFEAQYGGFGYSDADLTQLSPGGIFFAESSELSDEQNLIAVQSSAYHPLSPLIRKANRGVLAMDIDSPREAIKNGIAQFFKDHLEFKREDLLKILLTELYKTIPKLNIPNQLKQAQKWLEAIKTSK